MRSRIPMPETSHIRDNRKKFNTALMGKEALMKHTWIKYLAAVAAVILIAIPALAADKGSITVELTSRKVVSATNGNDKLERADKAKPGDVIEYTAVYRNKGKGNATNVKGIIPVPKGTVFIPGSAKPSQINASLDDKEYTPLPLKRKMTLPSGKVELRDVPYEQYRYIRWDLKTLSPGKSATVSVRVKISTEVQEPEAPVKK
jgi:uncharacterized repeat protein (TIGR01451 family)